MREVARWIILIAAVTAGSAPAVELTIGYPVLETAVTDQLFSDQGRYYLRGTSSNDCSYAYLENPRLGAGGGKLVLRAHFAGRLGTVLFGQCVGGGDAFEVVLTGSPRIAGEVVLLAEPQVQMPERPLYADLLHQTLEGAVTEALHFDLGAEVRRLATGADALGYKVTVQKLKIEKLTAQTDWLEIVLDFSGSVSR